MVCLSPGAVTSLQKLISLICRKRFFLLLHVFPWSNRIMRSVSDYVSGVALISKKPQTWNDTGVSKVPQPPHLVTFFTSFLSLWWGRIKGCSESCCLWESLASSSVHQWELLFSFRFLNQDIRKGLVTLVSWLFIFSSFWARNQDGKSKWTSCLLYR